MFDGNSLQNIFSGCYIHGRMYNSRDGFGFFYRYHPREIEKLSEGKLLGDIKIHCSVMERMNHRTANYAPGHIPAEFEVVDSEVPANVTTVNPGSRAEWAETRGLIDKIVLYRKHLYGVMLASVIFILVMAYRLSEGITLSETNNVVLDKIAGFFYSVLPDFFTGLINVVVVQKPYYLVLAIVFVAAYLKVRRSLYKETVSLCETLRHYIIDIGQKIDCRKKSSAGDND